MFENHLQENIHVLLDLLLKLLAVHGHDVGAEGAEGDQDHSCTHACSFDLKEQEHEEIYV